MPEMDSGKQHTTGYHRRRVAVCTRAVCRDSSTALATKRLGRTPLAPVLTVSDDLDPDHAVPAVTQVLAGVAMDPQISPETAVGRPLFLAEL